MKLSIRRIIREEIKKFLLEADPEKEKVDKEKQAIDKQKTDLDQKKFDFQKQQADDADRDAAKRDTEKEKETQEKEPDAEGGEKKAEPNISFKTQGVYYKEAMAGLSNLQLSNNDLLDEDEKNYVALAVQAAEGRLDKEFDKFLRKGYAGNVYGKDFPDEDIKIIIKFCKTHEIVR